MKYFYYFLLSLPIMEVLAALIRSQRQWGGKPFTSNGCNAVPEGNWGECCVAHDRAYRAGGWALARLKADCSLFFCVWGNRNPFAAIMLFVGVRCFGMWAFQYGKKREVVDA